MRKTILVVDDEPFIRQLIEQTLEDLEDEGIEILSADNGESGLDLIRENKPQLVFLDVMMPKMNGYDVCQAVKSDPELENTYIILLTAKGQEIDRQYGEQVGANMYLTKPFDPDELYAQAEAVFNL